ncbi:MAG: hypothetical protein OSA40_07000 [Phycisphaerales bacterium]|nr:hypothetical protein [Phycisphaerales bacterium]
MLTMAFFPRTRSLAVVTLLVLAGCRSSDSYSAASDDDVIPARTSQHAIVIVVVEDCPGAAPTAALVRSIAAQLGIQNVGVRTIVVRTPEEATAHRMLGSPTVLIDGLDIEPRARSRTDFAIACRAYGGRPTPPASLVEAAMRNAWAPQ